MQGKVSYGPAKRGPRRYGERVHNSAESPGQQVRNLEDDLNTCPAIFHLGLGCLFACSLAFRGGSSTSPMIDATPAQLGLSSPSPAAQPM